MAAEDRELRDQLEQLQVRVKRLRAELADPSRLQAVSSQVADQLVALRRLHAEKTEHLAALRPKVEDARISSLKAKREHAERQRGADVAAALRLSTSLGCSVGAVAIGLELGGALRMPSLGYALCAAGAAAFVGLIWKISRALSG